LNKEADRTLSHSTKRGITLQLVDQALHKLCESNKVLGAIESRSR